MSNRNMNLIIEGLHKVDEDWNKPDGEFAGWIAIYNGKKLEIKKSEANGIYAAKQLAIKKLKVPKSKVGLLSIEPAYESVKEEKSSDKVLSDFKKGDKFQIFGQTGTFVLKSITKKRYRLEPVEKDDSDISTSHIDYFQPDKEKVFKSKDGDWVIER